MQLVLQSLVHCVALLSWVVLAIVEGVTGRILRRTWARQRDKAAITLDEPTSPDDR